MRPFDGVIVVEGTPSDENVLIREGALRWRTPIAFLEGESRRVLGHAFGVTREGNEIRVVGQIDLPVGEYGVAAGIIFDAEEFDGTSMTVLSGELFDATITATPLFEGARIHVRRDHIDDKVGGTILRGVYEARVDVRGDLVDEV